MQLAMSMTATALNGAYLKLDRAGHHLEAIKAEVAGFDHGPNPIPGQYDPQTDTHVFRAQHDPPAPDALSAPLGEFFYNLRCVLDYIVYELITLAGNSVTTRSAFPVYTDGSLYRKEARSKIEGVPPTTVAVFERLQPFYGPNENPLDARWRNPESEPLAVLHRLNNRDKHRTLTLIESVGQIEPVFPDGRETFTRPGLVPLGALKRGAVIAAFAPGNLEPDVKVNLAATFHVGIYESGPLRTKNLVQLLDEILGVVRDRVVPSFAPFFTG
jgi:hypothetical protein